MSTAPAFIPLVFERLSPEVELQRARDFFENMNRRRTVREFSPEPVPQEVVELAIRTAGTAPSGAHKQPWRFVLVSDPEVKRQIRIAAEKEERDNYDWRMSEQWKRDLAPLGTDWHKESQGPGIRLRALRQGPWGLGRRSQGSERNLDRPQSTGEPGGRARPEPDLLKRGRRRGPGGVGRAVLALVGFLSTLSGCWRAAPEHRREDLLLGDLVDDYFSARFEFYPPEATAAGAHDFDGELPRLRGEDMRRRVAWLRDFRQRLTGVELTALSREAYFDALQLSFAVRGELHDLEVLETWQLWPRFYSELLARAVGSLVGPEFAPAHPRLSRLVARLGQIPAFAEAAGRNLERAPRVQIEAGLERLEQIERAVRALPKAFTGVTDQALLAELARVNEEAVRAVEALRGRLAASLPGAPAAFALGKENLRLLLLYGEMEERGLDELRELGERKMRETAEALRQAAMGLDPAKPVPALLEELGKAHSSSDEVIPFTEQVLAELYTFLGERSLVSLPADEPVRVMAAPAFALSPSPVALEPDRPGEQPVGEARLLVSVPELGWPPDRVEQQLRLLNRSALTLAAVSEVYPGRYLRLAAMKRAPTRVRRLLAASSNLEGWTRYTERLLIHEGYGAAEPGLRLVALHRELTAYVRLVAALGLHTETLTLAEAQNLLNREAYLDRVIAAREARDAAAFPDRLLPALGQLQIEMLRDDFLRARKDADGLRAFHDAFVSCGAPPVRLVRLMLLSGNEAVTLR